MKDKKEQWIQEVFDSLQGSRRAKPKVALYAKIEENLFPPEARIIPQRRIRLSAAAAVLLLILNMFAIRLYLNSEDSTSGKQTVEADYGLPLISNYNLYEQ